MAERLSECPACLLHYDPETPEMAQLHERCLVLPRATGRIDKARFHDDIPPPHVWKRWSWLFVPWPWTSIVEQVRERPGEEAIVAHYRTGTRRDTKLARQRDSNNLRVGLARRFPLERWAIKRRTVPDEWNHRLLVLQFLGYWASEQEAAEYRVTRTLEWRRRQEVAIANRARRALKEHAKAVAEAEAKRQEAIRSRRPWPE